MFVDNLQASGFNSKSTWQVVRQVLSWCQYLGIQDAPCKSRPSTQKPGTWPGCMFQIPPDKVAKTVTQAKWDKVREIVRLIAKRVLGGDGPLLATARYISLPHDLYDSLVLFLKGIHLTLNLWCQGQKDDGRKMIPKEWHLWIQVILDGDAYKEELAYLLAPSRPCSQDGPACYVPP
jgi:hypothetical protein